METKVVSRRVRTAYRAHVLLVVAEGCVVAASAGIATRAAALVGSSQANGGQGLWIALLTSAFAGAGWILERLDDAAAVARELDRSGGFRGAVLTVFELESAPQISGLARVLGRRLAPELSPTRFLAVSSRASAALLALPCLSFALWSLAADASEVRREPVSTDVAGAALAGAVDARAELLRNRAQQLASQAALLPEVQEEIRRIATEAAALRAKRGSSEGSDPELLRSLERRLEAAERAIPPTAVTRRGSGGTMGGPDTAASSAAAETMRDQDPDSATKDAAPESPSGADGVRGGTERGVLASRWWASRYDGIVERWVAARRTSPETPPR